MGVAVEVVHPAVAAVEAVEAVAAVADRPEEGRV